MLKKLEGKLSKLKLRFAGDVDIEMCPPGLALPVEALVDEKKCRIDAILSMSDNPCIKTRQLTQLESPEVLDFLTHSTQNYGPFAQAIRSKCDTLEKVVYELGPWASLKTYHNLYFGCYLHDNAQEDIMIGGIVAGIMPEDKEVEIGGLTRNDSKGKGFGTHSVMQVIEQLKAYIAENDIKIDSITSVVADESNVPARRMLEKAGFSYIKTGEDGVLYAYFLN